MERIELRTWTDNGSLTLEDDSLVMNYLKKTTVIPIAQIISFEIKDPKSRMRPGMITIRLAGSSGTQLRMTSFLSVGGSNNIEFPHAYGYRDEAYKMQRYISRYKSAPPAVSATAAVSPADEIRKFKSLLDDGIITEQEFEEKKRRLLGL